MRDRLDAIEAVVFESLVKRAGRVPAPRHGTRLDADWWLMGAGLLDVAEDLAEHLTHELDAEDLIDLALGNYTPEGLIALVASRWAEWHDAR